MGMTRNEQNMVFEMAKAITRICDALERLEPALDGEAQAALRVEISLVAKSMSNVIELINEEWLPK